mmetsp:Transcript_22354/g.16834  ORF Transcript_22354/g.16834 Transcript_22354/m.16834 type:complete len:97 (-) Transcript_22354:45-335(-)
MPSNTLTSRQARRPKTKSLASSSTLSNSTTPSTYAFESDLQHEGSRDGNISLDEWMEYYNNVSMSIDDDKYFELMMNSAWNLDNSRVTKKGWGGEF